MDLHLIPLPVPFQLTEVGGDMEVEEFFLEYGFGSRPKTRLDRAGSRRAGQKSTDETTEGPA
jgi:hypothetical protein